MGDFTRDVSYILTVLKDNPRGMSVSDIAAAIDINRNSVSRYLDMLLISGQVEMKTYGKAKVFYLSQRIPITAMMNMASDAVIVIDHQMQVIQVNDAACTLLGTSPESVVGRQIRDTPLVAFEHPLIMSRIKEAMIGEEFTDEIEIIRVGEKIYFHVKIIPSVFNDGAPGVTILMEDITSQKQSQEALRISERTYRSLVEEINDIIWNVDESEVFTFVSPRVFDVLGYHPTELLGTSLYDLMGENEARRVRALHSSLQQVENESFLVEYSLRHKNGSLVTLEVSGRPIVDEIGEVNGYRDVCRDITERKKAENLLKQQRDLAESYLDLAGVMIVVVDASGKIRRINRKGSQILGYEESDLIGKGWFETLVPERIRDGARTRFQALVRGDAPEKKESERGTILTRYGDEKTLLWNNSLLKDGNGRIIAMVSSGENIP